MIINVSINDNLFILYFHLNLDAKFEQYREHYVQIYEIVSNELNLIKNINYAINRFLNICVNRSISRKSTLVMIVIIFVSNSFFDKIQLNAQLKIKNVVIIIVKMCTICEKKYHTASEHRKQFNLKQDRDQFNEERDDRDSKRKRKNDNDDDERLNSKIDDEEKEHKMYIVIRLAMIRFRTESIDSILTFRIKPNRTKSSRTKPLKFRCDSIPVGLESTGTDAKIVQKVTLDLIFKMRS